MDESNQCDEDPYLDDVHRALELEKIDPILAFTTMGRLAKDGSINGILHFGWMYQNGIGTPKDLDQAELWFRQAYCEGSAQAAYHLGTVLSEKTEYTRACEAYAVGAKMNNVLCMYRLGGNYKSGLGVAKNLVLARSLFEQASSRGHLLARGQLSRLLMSGQFGVLNIFKGVFLHVQTIRDIIVTIMKNSHDERLST